MGLPVNKFIVATNINDTFGKYLNNGIIPYIKAIPSLSCAMDISIPNNLIRLQYLFKDHIHMQSKIDSFSINDIKEGKIILVDKPLRWTSFDVVKYIRKSLQLKFKMKKIKVGHAGTLDPLATGLLIICIGKQTKSISEYQNLSKTYTGKFKLGESTLSYDAETDINEKFEYEHITLDDLKNLANEFIGRNMQKPPIFSAIKKDGKRLYEYARENKEIDIDEREIDIYNFEIIDFTSPYVNFKIECSKGTYIRSIANDFGKRLNSGSYLYELRRTKIGDFCVLNAMDINIDVKT